MTKFKYTVEYGGGIGPNIWDAEMTVEATNIREALDVAEPLVAEAGAQDGVIFRIEQED